MDNYLSRRILLSVLAIAIIIIAFVGVSYALSTSDYPLTSNGNISLSINNKSNNVILSSELNSKSNFGLEILDREANVYDFNVSTLISSEDLINYWIAIEVVKLDGSLFSSNDNLKVQLEKKINNEYFSTFITKNPKSFVVNSDFDSMALYYGTFDNKSTNKIMLTDDFRLHIWLNKDYSDESFKIILKVYTN